MNMSTCMCVCDHSLSAGNVRAAKQKPSPGFCLAGSFMQLSVLGKGVGGIPGLAVLEKPTFHLFT